MAIQKTETEFRKQNSGVAGVAGVQELQNPASTYLAWNGSSGSFDFEGVV
jgi:hypothetical protein